MTVVVMCGKQLPRRYVFADSHAEAKHTFPLVRLHQFIILINKLVKLKAIPVIFLHFPPGLNSTRSFMVDDIMESNDFRPVAHQMKIIHGPLP